MKKESTIKKSNFTNTYGGLNLILGDDGKMYLEMQDCDSCEIYGPLTDEDVKAFLLLCKVKFVYDEEPT